MFLAQSNEQKNAKNAPMMDVLQSSLHGFRKVNILIIKCRKSHHCQPQQCYHKGLKGIAAFIFCLDLDFSFSGAFHDLLQI